LSPELKSKQASDADFPPIFSINFCQKQINILRTSAEQKQLEKQSGFSWLLLKVEIQEIQIWDVGCRIFFQRKL